LLQTARRSARLAGALARVGHGGARPAVHDAGGGLASSGIGRSRRIVPRLRGRGRPRQAGEVEARDVHDAAAVAQHRNPEGYSETFDFSMK
jgi:hypothetical protein